MYHGPVLNDAGQVAFRANLAGDGVDSTNNQGIWSEGSGSLSLVARTGSQAPGAPAGVNFRTDPQLELYSPVLNDVGQTAFFAATTDGKLGLWSEGSGNLTAVVRNGDPAPGTTTGVNINFGYFNDYLATPILNNAGKVSFRSSLSGTGVNSNNNFALWSEASGGLQLLARLGGQATGLPAGVNHGYMFDVGLNDSGQYVFFSFLSGNGVTDLNNQSLWSNVSGSLSMVARTGTQAAGLPSGVNLSGLFNVLDINDAGQFAFIGALSNENSQYGQDAVWLYDSGNVTLVARRGEHPPGTPDGVTWNLLGVPALNNAGRMMFGSQLAGSGVDTSNELAVFFADSLGNKTLVFREGDQAPGTPAGTFFDGFLEDTVARGGMNEAGQGAFWLDLVGDGVDSSNNTGLWATDADDVLQLIVREGDQLEVAPGDIRTISELNSSGIPGNEYGWPSAFNSLGQLAFWASFTDGSQGVFVSNAVAHLPGDFNNDGTVDAADYIVWRKTDNTQTGYDTWRANFGTSLNAGSGSVLPSAESLSAAIPEPSSMLLLMAAATMAGYRPLFTARCRRIV